MTEINKHIKNAINTNRDEIISFVKELVRTPSLANDEGGVQNIICLLYTSDAADE